MIGEQDIRPQVNDPIEVTIQGADDEALTSCTSLVEGAAGSDYRIAWPARAGAPVSVRDGDVLRITFSNRGWAYEMEAAVVARTQHPIPLVTVRPSGSPCRVQRRDYVRIPAEVDIELTARAEPGPESSRAPVSRAEIATRTVDLSGGGFAIRHSGAVPRGTLFDVKLKIPARDEPLMLTAQVVQCDPLETPGADYSNKIGFAIVTRAEAVRRQIMSFVIRLQQESSAPGR